MSDLQLRRVDPWGTVMPLWLAVMRAGDPSRPYEAAPYRADAADPSRRVELWLGTCRGDAVVAGQCDLGLERADGWVFAMVDRARRREGHGSAMVTHLVGRARAAGKPQAVTELILPDGADRGRLRFAAAVGFEVGDEYGCYLLSLGAPVAPVRPAEGYRVTVWEGEPPSALLGDRVGLQARFERDVPSSRDLSRRWTPQTLRSHLTAGRGHGRHAVEALAWQGATPVGFSTVIVDDGRAQAQQRDTFVDPAHRGAGLAVAMKSASAAHLRQRFPHVEQVRTFVHVANLPMQRVNAALGYRRAGALLELTRPTGPGIPGAPEEHRHVR